MKQQNKSTRLTIVGDDVKSSIPRELQRAPGPGSSAPASAGVTSSPNHNDNQLDNVKLLWPLVVFRSLPKADRDVARKDWRRAHAALGSTAPTEQQLMTWIVAQGLHHMRCCK